MAAGGDYFHIAIFGVLNPATQAQSSSLTVDKPAKADALHPPLYQKTTDHVNSLKTHDWIELRCQCCRCPHTMQAIRPGSDSKRNRKEARNGGLLFDSRPLYARDR